MFPRGWPVVLGGVACALGCAAQQLDEMPNDGSSATAAAGGGGGGSGSGSGGGGGGGGGHGGSGGGSVLLQAGSASSSAGTSSQGGTGSGSAGTSTGTAGSGRGGGGSSAAGAAAGGATGNGGSGGTKPASTSLPFSEDFEDGAANGFIPYNDKGNPGPWVVVADGAGKVYQPQAAVTALELAVGGSTTWTDVAMTVKVRLNDADTDARVMLRFKEPKTYLVVELAEGKYKLRGRAAGSTTDLVAPSPKPVITAGTWYTVGVTAKGTSVTLTLDGKVIGSPAMCDAAISNGGIAVGADSGSVSFDDISVTAAP